MALGSALATKKNEVVASPFALRALPLHSGQIPNRDDFCPDDNHHLLSRLPSTTQQNQSIKSPPLPKSIEQISTRELNCYENSVYSMAIPREKNSDNRVWIVEIFSFEQMSWHSPL